MSASRGRRITLTLLALASAGCHHARPVVPPPAPIVVPELPVPSAWEIARDSARELVMAGRFADAKRVLTSFSMASASSDEMAEAEFQRALLEMDPSNPEGSVRDASALLERYLMRGPTAPRAREASAMRALALTSDSLRLLLTLTRQQSDLRDRAAAEELTKRSAELDSVRAELERIKRRLSGRRP